MASHDITHCHGTDCDKKENCHRFLQYLVVPDYITLVSILFPKDCIKNKHQSYWEIKDADKPS